jgi:hypothetical protein
MAKQIEGQDGGQPVFQVGIRIGGFTPKASELVDLLNQLLEEPALVGSVLDRVQNLVQEFN